MNLKKFYEQRYGKSIQTKTDSKKKSNSVLIKEIKKPTNKKILEVGAGPGSVLKKFKNNELFALDLSKENIKILNQFSKAYKIDVSDEKFPFKSNVFNIIICSEIIEHIFDCQHTVNEMYRVLSPGGKLYIQTHNSFNILMRLKYALGIIPTESLDVSGQSCGEHIRLFNHKNLKILLLRAGFKKKKISDRSWSGTKKLSFHVSFFKSLISRHILYVAKK